MKLMAEKGRPPLRALAFILCDSVISDKITNKNSLIGLFNIIYAKKFPFVFPVINAFISLTQGHAQNYECSLSCVKEDTNKQIWSSPGKINMTDPLGVLEINFEIRNILFPEAGIYRFEFSCDNVPIISRKFQLIERK
jgi:hypothetical protein